MMELQSRLQRAIDDLQVIKDKLEAAAGPPSKSGEKEHIVRDPQAMAQLRDLKTLVDHMRHLLWAYLDTSDQSNGNVASRLQSVRMQRVTEMLKALEPEMTLPTTAALPEATTFFDLIHDIAHSTLDRHQGR
ncbi:MAG TPA: hypothetical protein VM009_05300 [Terriglobales bacterium]|nr:hypothetical protein [Terriglobales bacterium]